MNKGIKINTDTSNDFLILFPILSLREFFSECEHCISREYSTGTTLYDNSTPVNVTVCKFDSFIVCGNSYSFHREHY